MVQQQQTQSSRLRAVAAVVLVAGLWLIVSGALIGYDGRARAVEVIVGIALIVLSSVQLMSGPSHLLSVLTVWTGVLLLAAPVVLRYGFLDRIEAAYVNDMLTAVVVIVAGVLGARWAKSA